MYVLHRPEHLCPAVNRIAEFGIGCTKVEAKCAIHHIVHLPDQTRDRLRVVFSWLVEMSVELEKCSNEGGVRGHVHARYKEILVTGCFRVLPVCV
jgi:hypothetical protein